MNQISKLSRAVEQSGEFICILSKDGTIEYVNPAIVNMTGYKESALLGKDSSFLYSPEKPIPYIHSPHTSNHTKSWHGEITGLKKNGTTYPAISTISPIKDKHNDITHYIFSIQDISDFKKLEEELFQAKKLESIGTLVGGIAHNFNNMLAVVIGNLFFLKKDATVSEPAKQNVAHIESITFQMAEQIKALLTFARKDNLEKSVISVAQVIQSAVLIIKPTLPKDINLKINTCPDMRIYANQAKLVHCLISLLTNAAHALKNTKQATISIETSLIEKELPDKPVNSKQPMVAISVTDNGVGIAEAIQEQIFEPFFTTNVVGQGVGLGLSSVYGTIKSFGGEVQLESKLGKGACFKILLPTYNNKT